MNNDKENIFNTDITADLPEFIRKQIVRKTNKMSSTYYILKILNDYGNKKVSELVVGIYRLYKIETKKTNVAILCNQLINRGYIDKKISTGIKNTNSLRITEKGKQKIMEFDNE